MEVDCVWKFFSFLKSTASLINVCALVTVFVSWWFACNNRRIQPFSPHAFIFTHTEYFCNASAGLSTSTSDPLPLLHNALPPAGSPPSLRSVFPASDPGLFLWFRKWLTCHRKQMGVWAWQVASSPHPLFGAASIKRWGLSPHDTNSTRGFAALYYAS